MASQLLDRLERSEKKSAELELRLLARDDQARQAQVREEEARRRGREQGGYQPPAAAPDVGLDREARNLLRMTPEDYQFPVPTRVTNITGHRPGGLPSWLVEIGRPPLWRRAEHSRGASTEWPNDRGWPAQCPPTTLPRGCGMPGL